MQDIERGETRQRKLELLLDVLAEAKELKPGAVNRHVLVALVRIHPWLTPEMVAQPRIEPLAQRIGLTAHVIKTTRQTMGNHRGNEQAAFSKAFNGAPSGSPEDNIIRAMAILKQLATLLEYTKPDPLNVASLLLGYSQPNLQSVLIEAEELRASRLGQTSATRTWPMRC